MKPKTKKTYVSSDGRIFETLKEYREWEIEKLYCDPVHLATQQIIGLMEAAFRWIFIEVPRDYRSEVTLYVRKELREEINFDFYFEFMGSRGTLETYNGSVKYCRGRDVTIQLGYYDENENFQISPDWRHWSDFRVRKTYDYFESIGYFTKKREEPEINPLFRKKGWHKIYSKAYDLTPIEIIR